MQKGIKEAFIAALVEAAARYKPGDPLDPKTKMGPLVDKQQLDTVGRYIRSAQDEGGNVIFGGEPAYQEGQGFYAGPTIVTDAHNGMTFVQEEIFGPVVAVCEFET